MDVYLSFSDHIKAKVLEKLLHTITSCSIDYSNTQLIWFQGITNHVQVNQCFGS